jgi:putative flavoprotein involved in K+ transport
MAKRYETIIIGAGQAGLATSYLLTRQNRPHTILERKRIGESWRSGKWDSFTLVTPNYMLQLPEFAYEGDNPYGFLSRDEILQYLEAFAHTFDPPVETGVDVRAVDTAQGSGRFRLETTVGPLEAENVIVATGTFQQPSIPASSSRIASGVAQIHSSEYRNNDELPSGAVLVVGSAQSGCQIADELSDLGRSVYLSTGKANRLPRRYRGHDSFWWAEKLGILDQTIEDLPSPDARFVANPQVSGKDGGKTLSLHSLAAKGVALLGRARDAQGRRITIGNDLMDHVSQADEFAANFKQGVDTYISKTGMDAPEPYQPDLKDAYDCKAVDELDLADAGISTVIWATGYRYDYSWINCDVLDEVGYPKTKQGVTEEPGLFFVGQHFLDKRKSGLLLGVAEDAKHIVSHITGAGRENLS